jgi:hypothetical protein
MYGLWAPPLVRLGVLFSAGGSNSNKPLQHIACHLPDIKEIVVCPELALHFEYPFQILIPQRGMIAACT